MAIVGQDMKGDSKGYAPVRLEPDVKGDIPLESGVPNTQYGFPAVPDGWPDDIIAVIVDTQFTIEVPEGSESLLIQLEAANLNYNLQLYVRHGQPVALGATFIYDYMSDSDFGFEEVGRAPGKKIA